MSRGRLLPKALELSLDLESQDEELEPHRDVEFLEMPVRQILNRCDNPRMPFRWTINPYRGCEFGCVYCYARYTHEFLELRDPMDFERRIFVKRMAAEVLSRTLSRTPLGNGRDRDRNRDRSVPAGGAEVRADARDARSVRATRRADLSITTKSTLVARDLDLLTRISSRSHLSVNFSCITLNPKLARVLEPRAPRPELRLRTLAALTRAGIACNVLMMPMIPGLTDAPRSIEAVIKAARDAGAISVGWRSLFLKPAAARRFIPFVRERFPELAPRIDSFYACAVYAPTDYDEKLGATFDRLRLKYGFIPASQRSPQAQPAPRRSEQLSLRMT